ncbi:putative sodium-dependent multivitamin transporter isoform X2 [Dermacentor variabilis]|uniref:putative sodium-dependent multivitamin transporter isoform X2 n=1 Tax=Dermacentor variabilis TaxID=34621 RepID=UPI003F5C00CB
MGFHPADYAVFCLLTAFSFALGLYFSLRRAGPKSPASAHSGLQHEDVFLGGRTLPAWSLAVSLLASVATGVGVVSLSAHQYAYGLHFVWNIVAMAFTTPFIVYVFLPVLYRLKVTSVFQYLRMRFGNATGISACVIYFFFSLTLGAVSIYSAAVGMSTMLNVPLSLCNVVIGVLGTTYTALGGLRGVVWADCVQGIVLFAAPFVIIAKIAYDSANLDKPLRPLSDFDSKNSLFRLEVDASSDETFWAYVVASIPFHLVREGMDQMVAQRFLAARNIHSARRVVWAGSALVAFFILTISLTSLALTYWYRDCDPMLIGTITRYDQVVPLYVSDNLAGIAGLRGLFLAGLFGASISTVSSVINSHAATFYADVVAPYTKLGVKQTMRATHLLEFGSGTLMTAFAVVVPYIGTAMRIIMAFYSGASGPFAGMITVALCLPWTNTKGTAVASSIVFALELYQTVGRTLSGLEPPRMNTTLLRCRDNVTASCISNDLADLSRHSAPTNNLTCVHQGTSAFRMTEVFLLYRLSSCWSSFIAMLMTVSLSLALSLFLGSREDLRRSLRFSSPPFLSLWARLGFLHGDVEEHNEGDTKSDEECAEGQLATTVPLGKVSHDHPFYVGANDLLS